MALLSILLIVAIMISIIIIILWTANLIPPLLLLQPECQQNSDCVGTQVCQNNACRNPIGAACQDLRECVEEAVLCQEVCLDKPVNGPGQPCPCRDNLTCQRGLCRAPVGATCQQNQDCETGLCLEGVCRAPTGMTGQTGMTCSPYSCSYPNYPNYPDEVLSSGSSLSCPSSSETSNDGPMICLNSHDCPNGYYCAPRFVYRGCPDTRILPVIAKSYLHGENAVDVTSDGKYLYILLEGGDILKIIEGVPQRIRGSRRVNQIFYFTGHLYGQSDGRLYILEESSHQWHRVDNLPTSLTQISGTLNGNYVWIQTNRYGYLYDDHWQILEKVKIDGVKRREYGWDRDVWADFYPDGRMVTSTGHSYSQVTTAAFLPDNYLLHYSYSDQVFLVKVLRYHQEYVPYLIMNRSCQLMK